ncbi:response regulator [Vampirovibrio sp.]|uniref:response regulator n=1 Tax=Vampirovibrio sp. TaxID=2717857 RepID=UPI0035937EA0
MTNANAPKIRVLLVDDSRLTRISVKTTLKVVQLEIELVGEAEDGTQAIEMASALRPHVILMDIGMPIMDGVRATQAIKTKHPEIKVVMLTSHEEEADVLDAFSSGANSYCLKETPPEMLVHVIKSTAMGACWIDPKIVRIVMSQLQPAERNPYYNPLFKNSGVCLLTEREVDVLKLVTQGLNNAEISERLYITMNTVKTHLKNIFQKLEVEDRTAAALKALKERII